MENFALENWSNGDFFIEDGVLKLNYCSKPSLLEITKKIRDNGTRGPVLLRFPHLIKKQIQTLYKNFNSAIKTNNYQGGFQAVYPLKVNQFPEVIKAVTTTGREYNYGLEAGSKAELLLAMSEINPNAPITVNGFKDEEMLGIGFVAAAMQKDITITVEGLGELKGIIALAKKTKLTTPKIGIRVRLHSTGSGTWAKSGGMEAKFGLTSTEILEATSLLKEAKLLHKLTMIHFHIGSQMVDIAPIKRALREAGNIYAELKMLGADQLDSINIGGGLAVEYEQHTKERSYNYSLEEFSSSVVFLLGDIMDTKGVQHPNIFTESGRFIVASHTILITPVLELFTQDYQIKHLKLKTKNPPLVEELSELYEALEQKNSIEYLHDALDHIESLLTLFDLGYIDLQDRSNAEILVHNIIKKALYLKRNNTTTELKAFQARLQERYLINASIFQSLPDYWGIAQHFPIMPLHHLKTVPLRPASLWDITCDSDGEIGFDTNNPLFLHDINLDEEEYFLGFFNVGAYQETLGMMHNLFSHPSSYTIAIDTNSFTITDEKEADSIGDVLESLGYNKTTIFNKLKTQLLTNSFMQPKEKTATLSMLELFLKQNSYLRTIN